MKKSLVVYFLLLCVCRASTAETLYAEGSKKQFCMQSVDNQDQENDSVNIQTYLRVNAGKGIGFKNGYTSLGLLLNIKNLQNKLFQPFVDLRGHYFNDKRWAMNLGVGTRYLSPSLKNIFGCNVFYDFRQRSSGYHQVGLGLEVLGNSYDIRLNGYMPIGNNTGVGKPHIFTYPGEYLAICQTYQKPLYGGDAEIETSLKRCGSYLCLDPYFALGSYYYHQNYGGDIVGGKLRLGLNYLDCIIIEVRVSHDSIFQTCVQGVLSVKIPWGNQRTSICRNKCPNTICQGVMDQPPQRQEIIVEGEKRCRWKTNY